MSFLRYRATTCTGCATSFRPWPADREAPRRAPAADPSAGVEGLLAGADHVDVKTVTAPGTLAAFVSELLGWQPAGLRWLFSARAVLARALRLEHRGGSVAAVPGPGELDLVPGGPVAFFTVTDVAEDRRVVLEAMDNHLTAYLVVLAASSHGGPRRFDVVTVVRYRRWTGPVYFNLIRPFHHLVVAGMARAVARRLAADAQF